MTSTVFNYLVITFSNAALAGHGSSPRLHVPLHGYAQLSILHCLGYALQDEHMYRSFCTLLALVRAVLGSVLYFDGLPIAGRPSQSYLEPWVYLCSG